MVPILSSFEKLSAGWISTLALFGFELESLADSRATNITLKGQEPVLPRAAKITFIIPKRGLEEVSLQVSNLPNPAVHKNDAKTASIFLLGPAGPDDPTNF